MDFRDLKEVVDLRVQEALKDQEDHKEVDQLVQLVDKALPE